MDASAGVTYIPIQLTGVEAACSRDHELADIDYAFLGQVKDVIIVVCGF